MDDTNKNLFIEISDEVSENENIDHLFTSSDSSTSKQENKKNKKNIKNITKITNQPEILNTTTGLNINIIETNIDNNLPDFIDSDNNDKNNKQTPELVHCPSPKNNHNQNQNNKIKQDTMTTNSTENTSSEQEYVIQNTTKLSMLPQHLTHSTQSIAHSMRSACSGTKLSQQQLAQHQLSLAQLNQEINNINLTPIEKEHPDSPACSSEKRGVTTIVESMLKHDTNINGWDNDANVTAKNWYKIFKQQSFIYQWILDRNRRIGTKLAYISIISSSLLGIFTGFKLWVANDAIFQTVSNILLMLLNFLVALITASSKNYTDDARNEKIRVYIEDVDSFLGEISAQVLKSPVYRMDADEFFKTNNDKYTKLISSAPNLSINEINLGKKQYMIYLKHCDQHV